MFCSLYKKLSIGISLTSLVVFSCFPLYAQQPGLFIEGTVREEKTKLSDAIVSVLLGGKQINTLTTPANGLFSMTLNYNNDYVLQFSKDGYVTKKISVSTKGVPPEEVNDIYEFSGFEVSLFKNIPDLDVSLLQKPIGKIAFINSDAGFDYDAAYTTAIQEQLQKFQEDLVIKKKAAEELAAKYNAVVARADKALNAKDYKGAIAAYSEASTLKPGEQYPKGKISEAEKALSDLAAKDASEKERLAQEKEINDKYNAAVANADKAFGAKDYNGAKSGYSEASGIKPSEQYPKNKINEIDKMLGQLAAAEEAKKKTDEEARKKAEADAAAKKKSEEDAAAAKKKSEEETAAKEKALTEKYNAAISKADNAFSTKDYNGAKTAYNEASGIKPSEKYPKDKITEIDKLLGQLAAAEEAKKKADEEARKKAEADAAAKKKLEEETAAKEKALTEKYNAAISKADKAIAAKDYNNAKAAYTDASGIKPSEKYPQDKISEISKILAELAAKESSEKELAQKYNDAISRGDKAFSSKDYNGAKSVYSEASGLKPSEQYPKTKISEIDKILSDIAAKDASEKATNEKYNAAISKADKSFGTKDYSGAKSAYTEASGIKPTEKYPKDKIAEIDNLLAQLAAQDEAKRKAEEDARKKTEADAAAKSKAEADAVKALNDKYNAAISKADKSFGAKDYNGAKTTYAEASSLKAAEQYPKNKIAEIDKILAQLAAEDEAKRKATEEARLKAETDAAARKKSEDEAAKALSEKYNATIAKADKDFTGKNYPDAKASYIDASKLKPAERYPKDKISAIDKIMAAELAAKKKAEEDAAALRKATEEAARLKAEEEKKMQQATTTETKEPEKEKIFVDMKEDTAKGPSVITKQKSIEGSGTIKGKGKKKKSTVVF